MDLFVFVFIGLGLFICGQFYGEYRMKKKAMLQMQMMHSGMSSYHDSLKVILKEHGVDLDAMDKLAVKRHLEESVKQITSTIETVISKTKDEEKEQQSK